MERQCPRCSKLVNASAAVCRHCSWNFARPVTPKGGKGTKFANILKGIGSRHSRIENGAKSLSNIEKKCPRCAETIQSEARICRYCNFKFGPFVGRNIGMGIATAILVIYLAGRGGTDAEQSDATATALETQTASATPVTIAELFSAYEENEARAQSAYGNQMLVVQGDVTDIDLDITDDPVVRLIDNGQEINTYFDMDRGGKGTIDLKKGERAAIACNEVRETLGRPSLRDCFVAEVKAN